MVCWRTVSLLCLFRVCSGACPVDPRWIEEPASGSCYGAFEPLGFTGCVAYCDATWGGALASISSRGLNDWLRANLDSGWIGYASRRGDGLDDFEWVSGVTSGYTNWAEGKLADIFADDLVDSCERGYCTSLEDGEWFRKGCGERRACLCEVPAATEAWALAHSFDESYSGPGCQPDYKAGLMMFVYFWVVGVLFNGVVYLLRSKWDRDDAEAHLALPVKEHEMKNVGAPPSAEGTTGLSLKAAAKLVAKVQKAAKKAQRRVDTSTTTGARAILMMVIAINHTLAVYRPYGNTFVGGLQGGAAVQGFFCISGFVMALAYAHRDFLGSGPGDLVARAQRRSFYVKRFARLAPLYYASELLSTASVGPLLQASDVAWLPFSLTATTSWGASWVAPNNEVLWSVSTIAFFYYRLPWIFHRLKKWTDRRRAVGVMALAMALKFWIAVPYFKVSWEPYWFVRLWPPCVMGVFLMGALVAIDAAQRPLPCEVVRRQWGRRADFLSLALSVFVVTAAVVTREGRVEKFAIRVAVEATIPLPFIYWLESLTVAGDCSYVGRLLSSTPLQKLGDYAYAIYCFHMIFVDFPFYRFNFYVVILVYILFSIFFAEPFEKRCSKWLLKKLDRPMPAKGAHEGHRGKTPFCKPTCLPQRFGGWGTKQCFDIDSANDKFSVAGFLALSCPCCIPERECACFNPFNPCGGCGNCCEDCRTPPPPSPLLSARNTVVPSAPPLPGAAAVAATLVQTTQPQSSSKKQFALV